MPCIGIGDTGALEAERLDVRLAAGGDEEMRAFQDGGLAVLGEMHGDALHRALDALHPRIGMQHDLRVGEALDQDGGSLRVLVGKKAADIEHADMGAEHAVRLRQLKTRPVRRRSR